MSLFGMFGTPNIEKLKAKRDVQGLVKALGHENTQIRSDAAMALGELRDTQAVEPLISALKDESIRGIVAEMLGKHNDRRAVKPLVAIALGDKNLLTQRSAREALRLMTWEPADDDEHSLFFFIKQEWAELAKLGVAGIKPLAKVLDTYAEERVALAKASSEIRDAHAVAYLIEPLLTYLEKTDPGLQKNAAEVLGEIGDSQAVESLIAAIQRTTIHTSPSGGVSVTYRESLEAIARALGEIGDARAVEPLVKLLGLGGITTVDNMQLSSAFRTVRAAAAEALGKIGDRRAIEPLEAVSNNQKIDARVREEASNALRRIQASTAS